MGTPGRSDPSSAAPPASAPAPKPTSGPQRAMHKLGLVRDIDLALHLPLRYEDDTRITPIAQAVDGDNVQLQVQVRDVRLETRTRKQWVARVADASGELVLRWINVYPALQKQVAVGAWLRLRGEVRGGFLGREIVHPQFKACAPDAPLPLGLTPIYPASAQLPQAYVRKAVAGGLLRAGLHEVLPAHALPPPQANAPWPSLREALRCLHQPPPGTDLQTLQERRHPAWQRLKLEELLAQQLSQVQARAQRASLHAPPLAAVVLADAETQAPDVRQRLGQTLPFVLTSAQQRVVAEIEADLALPAPMHRLLQGDVGSGKTVVAALAAARAISAGWQCALMAPTEILAEQHFRKLITWLVPLGVQVAWLSGARKGAARRTALAAVASGEAMLVVGTHAVIQDEVRFAHLGLAIVDEQHRFGVVQRLALRAKLEQAVGQGHAPSTGQPQPAKLTPHLLMMSATPIPRTLAMTVYADLDISTIDELPPGRTPVSTRVFDADKRLQVLARVRDDLASGRTRQVYWVCPLIEESEHLDLQTATATHTELSAALPGVMVGLLHGRMPAAEKAAVMSLFTAGQMQVLVATTVIEVGVDVPEASLMVIEHAERFGLAQLHQLRGRVGRGAAASVCVLLYTGPLSPTAKDRLRAMAETTDGFEIARRDLAIRGPGEFLGARQSGEAWLRFADPVADEALLQHARHVAPELLRDHPQAAQAHVARWLGTAAEFLKA